jgi:class 3 adenylate cyclase
MPGGRQRPLAERRLVSVLFLDLVGFTTLSESLDPEDVRELQWRYFELARATVAHYGGSLEKFIGDAVMAVWGTPIAHEDDAERAVRAAIEVVAAVGTQFAARESGQLQARGAVTTGEAAVTLDAEGQGMVTGDLVNTASRLQGAAEPGTVLVDDATRHVVGEALAFEAAGEKTLKGKAAPVRAWRALAVAARAGTARSGHRGPFVGRDPELRALRELLASVVEERRLRVVSMLGIAGIGKSRLAWELEHAAPEDGLRAAWYAGRAPGYGEGIAFAPLAEMVRRSAGIAESDAVEMAHRSLARRLLQLGPDADERGWLEPRLLVLLEPREDHGFERDELFAAWRRFFELEAEEAPVVLLFEDLQWADPGLLDFIEYVADWSRHRPILLLTLARPELLDARPTWGAGLAQFTAMHLDRLSDAAIEQLLGALAAGLAPGDAARVRERADGVPLYAVEMARMLTERGSRAEVQIPESLQALLAARIDALPPDERSLLLGAAVLGRRFPPDALAAVSDADRSTFSAQLRNLVRREFLSMDDEPRSPGRGQLSFVQELVREVAYHTLSRRERRARHLAVIAYLESVGEQEMVEPIAEHLLAAQRATGLDAAEEQAIAQRAREALHRAAEQARSLHAPHRALAHLEDAIGLADDAAVRAELSEEAGLAARAAARFATGEQHLRTAIDLRLALGDAAGAARHRAQLARLLLQAQRSDTALAELGSAWTAATSGKGAGPIPPELPAELARAHLLRGDLGDASQWAERAIAAAEDAGAEKRAVLVDAQITRATALVAQGRRTDGLEELRRAVEHAEEAGNSSVQLRALNNLAWLVVTDDPGTTFATARRGLDLAIRLGNREQALQLLDIASIVSIDSGDWAWALRALEEAAAEELPSAYRLDYAATRTILAALQGGPVDGLPDEPASLEPDLDAQALGWVDHARGLLAFVAGDLPVALDRAWIAARQTEGYERWASLVLAGRVASWMGDTRQAAQAAEELAECGAWGRAADAALAGLQAAIATLEIPPSRRGPRAATKAWDAALGQWRGLDLPLRLGLCHLDRWRLLGRPADRDAARGTLEPLGAAALIALLDGSTRPPARRSPRRRS